MQIPNFAHSTPELYDRYMGPLLFEPYAKVLAERAALLRPNHILKATPPPSAMVAN